MLEQLPGSPWQLFTGSFEAAGGQEPKAWIQGSDSARQKNGLRSSAREVPLL